MNQTFSEIKFTVQAIIVTLKARAGVDLSIHPRFSNVFAVFAAAQASQFSQQFPIPRLKV
jgi:hypothetical protein